MQIPFDDLLRMAAEQKQPQRLLFVFATRDIREGHENLDDPDFAIIPQMYTDKTLEHINAFADLANEAHEADCTWDLLFASGLDGENGQLPTLQLTDERLDLMVSAIQQGIVEPFAVYDREGEPVNLSRS